MPGLLSYIRQTASEMAYNSALYNWSLRSDVPERLIVRPVDPWAGNADHGCVLCEGDVPDGYEGAALHGFAWLRDLRAYAQERGAARAARAQARVMIQSWIERHGRWDAVAWDTGLMGERIAMWISAYEFFAQFSNEASADDHEFQDMFFESLVRQASHLARVLARDSGVHGVCALKAVKGLLYAGLAFEGREIWVDQALDGLKRHVDAQILSDGSHRSRSPEILLDALQILLDIRSALLAGDYPVPEYLHGVIQKAGRAVQFFRANDRGLFVFNGGQEGDVKRIDAVLAQAGVLGAVLKSLPQGGYERLTLGRSSLMFDCGKDMGAPYDRRTHAGPLSFEMSYGRERLFVNCGTHSGGSAEAAQWREALRATPAHNAVTLNDRNACEIGNKGSFVRGVRNAISRREDSASAILVEAQHDGYETLNGVTHRRRLYVSDDGHDVRGEDVLVSAHAPLGGIEAAVRFHLHPRVMVSLIRDGQEALMRLPGGAGWRFYFSGGCLALEPGVYMGERNVYQKTQQLVIHGQITDKKHKISWVLQKEG